jgi:hypothetical protein
MLHHTVGEGNQARLTAAAYRARQRTAFGSLFGIFLAFFWHFFGTLLAQARDRTTDIDFRRAEDARKALAPMWR